MPIPTRAEMIQKAFDASGGFPSVGSEPLIPARRLTGLTERDNLAFVLFLDSGIPATEDIAENLGLQIRPWQEDGFVTPLVFPDPAPFHLLDGGPKEAFVKAYMEEKKISLRDAEKRWRLLHLARFGQVNMNKLPERETVTIELRFDNDRGSFKSHVEIVASDLSRWFIW